MNKFVDLTLIKKDYFYDISFDSQGRLQVSDDFVTAFLVSYFTEIRANRYEEYNEVSRRGWWGNLYKESQNLPKLGSKLWLLNQSANTSENLTYAKSYLKQAFRWLIVNKYANKVDVSGSIEFETMYLNIVVYRNDSIINELNVELWGNTLKSIEVKSG